ncbi:peptide-N4-(N-acetyl-beta-glucosaminyl)asparagine amidase A [Cucumis melo var. makuwa]|uniref:Peptide-N4-(N-acetyl-beta- glucosaminyl)asparagine amidase A n=2 Tax=Cucumis melo TaxID=3656 RepID=A0A1S3CJY5_CUCME|nr:peptide-N4-(N-acetyl-beta-glucosaminyl)asparagine amidase A [Cucumis melo]KAA0066768.1 peptide-N4-(N-acetyl-beta-glucosaminyl)asparagine amidase A [Cucumis melo var. makuwa]TYK27915.1 peptide-N4-(N-acetyl-beta-glucosaminyl)asparagine amidase A [Cucumis melo var. makuwa]
MASSSFLLLISLLLLLLPFHSDADLHKTRLRQSDLFSESHVSTTADHSTPPTVFFEVTKPIVTPKAKPCSLLVLHHDFAYTYGKPPVLADYTPPSHCSFTKFSKIVLEWKATCRGRQFDRIFGVWLGGVEILRSCTAEPRATGIVWTVQKDITRYNSLLSKNQTLAVYLGNLVDKTYTGIYNVKIHIHFYPEEEGFGGNGVYSEKLGSAYDSDSRADLILPISRNLPLNDGLWFEVQNSTDVQLKEFEIPQNVYRALLEVYVSFHENDEFWYSNLPNDYIVANNLTDTPGNGPFREVLVDLDGDIVAAVWPFTVIYTGGVNPLLWRPISGIGSFNLPSYDIELTPFLGNLLDGKGHSFGFRVTHALNVWFINANLHLWLDDNSVKTEAKLLNHIVSSPSMSQDLNFTGADGTFLTKVTRSVSSAGWVKSSFGTITTLSNQDLSYSNLMMMGNNGSSQTVNQEIHFNSSVYAKQESSHVYSSKTLKTFPLYMYSNTIDQGNGSYRSIANLTLGFNEKKTDGLGSFISSLKNVQNGQGLMVVKGNLVTSGLGSTQQDYRYYDDVQCYSRSISSSNYTILHDNVKNMCGEKQNSSESLRFRRWPIPARRASLDSNLFVNNGHV